jgi:hypothetical protein
MHKIGTQIKISSAPSAEPADNKEQISILPKHHGAQDHL